jgi:hypothetical protein
MTLAIRLLLRSIAATCAAALRLSTARIIGAEGSRRGKSALALLLGSALALTSAGNLTAQGTSSVTTGIATPSVLERGSVDALKGAWVRPDGGYTIVITSVGTNGQLEAMYFNPNQLPFAKAQASWEGPSLRVHFELQAGGYAGSTYDLLYDPASDRLRGTYYQAVVKQKFEVYFARR